MLCCSIAMVISWYLQRFLPSAWFSKNFGYEFLKINILILLRVKIDYDFASWFIKGFAWFMISILRNNKLRKTILHWGIFYLDLEIIFRNVMVHFVSTYATPTICRLHFFINLSILLHWSFVISSFWMFFIARNTPIILNVLWHRQTTWVDTC